MQHLTRPFNSYKTELQSITKELSTLPKGFLLKKNTTYAHRIGRNDRGITTDSELIQRLCRKRFLTAWKLQHEHNLSILAGKNTPPDSRKPREIIRDLPATYQQLPEHFFHHPAIKTWKKETFQKNNFQKENLIYESSAGTYVRSKSELLIANLLEKYGLVYRYDALVQLEGKKISPDFLIKNPFNQKTVIWEHFGALNQENYIEKMHQKMSLYQKNGYKQFENIVYTFEPDVRVVQHLQQLIELVLF